MEEAKTRYLVIDDDAPFRERLVRALRRRGFLAQGAASLHETLSALAKEVPDRIILDLRIGKDNGLALQQHLQERGYQIPTVMVTGYGSVATAVEAMRAGCVHYLTRPVSLDQVLTAFTNDEASKGVSAVVPEPPSLEQVEWDHLQRVLTDYEGNITRAARALGLHRRSLQRKLSRLSSWKESQQV